MKATASSGVRRIGLLFALLALLVTILVQAGAQQASATAGVDDYPYKNDSWTQVDPWSFYKRECTSFVAWRMNNDNGMTSFRNTMTGPNGQTRTLSNANLWGSRAQEMGYAVDMNAKPGAVAWWSSGHVAWVRSVSGSNVVIEEYNWNYTHNYNTRTIAASSVSGYIHFKDLAPQSPSPTPPPGVNLSGAIYDGRDTLSVGQTLQKNHYLTSADGRYVLFMQNDGNLVQYGPGLAALWWTGTSTGHYVAMQSDGNLVMYQSDGATAVWSTSTSGTNGAYIAVQRDGNIVMYQSDGATTVWSKGATGAPWTATSVGSQINIGQTLPANRFAQSSDGRFRLFLHPDGNLILYSPGYHVTWANWKTGTNGAYVAMQSDSNFVEYLSNGATAVWSSATSGSGGAYVAVQNDGNVVMYQSNGATAVWSTHTGGVF